MRYVYLIGLVVVSVVAAAQALPDGASDGRSSMRSTSGTEALSLEEAARSYFMEIAHIDSSYPSANMRLSPKDVLQSRDGLTDAEANEVIAIARRLNAGTGREAQRAWDSASYQKLCADLRAAKTPQEKIAAFENSDARSMASNRELGASLLSELTPATRSRLTGVVNQHRNDTTVVRQEWKDVPKEAIDMQQQRVCGPS